MNWRRMGAGSDNTSSPSEATLPYAEETTSAHAARGLTVVASCTFAVDTENAVWVSVPGGLSGAATIGEMAMTLAPASATPEVR